MAHVPPFFPRGHAQYVLFSAPVGVTTCQTHWPRVLVSQLQFRSRYLASPRQRVLVSTTLFTPSHQYPSPAGRTPPPCISIVIHHLFLFHPCRPPSPFPITLAILPALPAGVESPPLHIAVALTPPCPLPYLLASITQHPPLSLFPFTSVPISSPLYCNLLIYLLLIFILHVYLSIFLGALVFFQSGPLRATYTFPSPWSWGRSILAPLQASGLAFADFFFDPPSTPHKYYTPSPPTGTRRLLLPCRRCAGQRRLWSHRYFICFLRVRVLLGLPTYLPPPRSHSRFRRTSHWYVPRIPPRRPLRPTSVRAPAQVHNSYPISPVPPTHPPHHRPSHRRWPFLSRTLSPVLALLIFCTLLPTAHGGPDHHPATGSTHSPLLAGAAATVFTIATMNVCGIQSKCSDICDWLLNHKPSIAALSETQLSFRRKMDTATWSSSIFPNYNTYYGSHPNESRVKGQGVALCIHTSLNVRSLSGDRASESLPKALRGRFIAAKIALPLNAPPPLPPPNTLPNDSLPLDPSNPPTTPDPVPPGDGHWHMWIASIYGVSGASRKEAEAFYDALRKHMSFLSTDGTPFFLAGDFQAVPRPGLLDSVRRSLVPDRDVPSPAPATQPSDLPFQQFLDATKLFDPIDLWHDISSPESPYCVETHPTFRSSSQHCITYRRIDNVFAPHRRGCLRLTILPNEYRNWASDHAPVFLSLDLTTLCNGYLPPTCPHYTPPVAILPPRSSTLDDPARRVLETSLSSLAPSPSGFPLDYPHFSLDFYRLLAKWRLPPLPHMIPFLHPPMPYPALDLHPAPNHAWHHWPPV